MVKPAVISKTIKLEDGREIILETGQLAKQADGAVLLKTGKTILLATVVSAKEAREGTDFLPLTVDYQEKFYAAGRFPGGFLKRESRLSDYEVLICRMIDRSIRPLFPDDYHAETQIMISLISGDPNILPDCMAGLAASAALSVSDIPFQGPIAEVRVAKIDGKFVINPFKDDLERAELEMIVAGSMDSVNMVEGEMSEVSEDDVVEAIEFAHKVIIDHCKVQLELRKAAGMDGKIREYEGEPEDEKLEADIKKAFEKDIYNIAKKGLTKTERSEAFDNMLEGYTDALSDEDKEDSTKQFLIKKYFNKVKKEAIRNMVLTERTRLDGRQLNEIRPIWGEVDYLPAVHGSALFTRGETQALASLTLGSKTDEQMIDSAMFKGFSKFILHYNFPAFSTGEARPNRGPGRREIGHGNLAMRALKKVLPSEKENPYTIRIVSEILESNGSSSMATVCSGSMALMDAGIKIKGPVSGIAMGMISSSDGKYAILSDILGDEDHLGDMDFKVTGTENGITACQMDIKVEGLSYDVLKEALLQAKEGRLHILAEMNKVISQSSADLKDHAPRIERITIEKEFIGTIIGPGGRQIQSIQEQTGTNINIEEVDGKGIVEISSVDKASLEKAKQKIKALVAIPEVGKVYEGEVKAIMPFGAFVEFLPGKDGLLHVSEISWERINSMDGVFEVGQKLEVKLIEVDEKTGKSRLSRKVLLPKPEGQSK